MLAGGAGGLVETCLVSSLKEHVEHAEFTFGAGVLGSASAGVLGHEEPLPVVYQAAVKGAPASQQPS